MDARRYDQTVRVAAFVVVGVIAWWMVKFLLAVFGKVFGF